MTKGVVLLSGGLDSTVLASKLCQDVGAGSLKALTIQYGQKHGREIQSARKVAEILGIHDWQLVKLDPTIFLTHDSALTGDAPMPSMTYKALAETQGVSPTYVPFRNANFISVATTMALVSGAEFVAIAVHAEDARNWAYPDCTPEFSGAMANAIYVGTYHKVRLLTPFQWMMKRHIVELGLSIGAPFEASWSCYEGREKACGQCPTCVERLEAFSRSGWYDPIPYEGID